MGLTLGLGLQLAPGGHASSSSGSGGGGGGSAGIALVSHAGLTPSGNNGGTSSALNTTGANFICVAITISAAGGTATLTDSLSNSWTQLHSKTSGTENILFFGCYSPTTGSSHTFTIGKTGGAGNASMSACIAAFSGVVTLDVKSQNSVSSGLTVSTGSITPLADNELLLAAIGTAPAGVETLAIDGGFTKLDHVPFSPGTYFGTGLGYLIQTTAAAANPTWTLSGTTNSNPLVALIVSFTST